MSVEFHNTVDNLPLRFVAIPSRYQGKWLFCQHRGRDTYGCPGGRRGAGEKVEHTAHRELYEETDAVGFTLTPLGAYSARETAGDPDTPGISCETFCYGDITEPGSIPKGYEIARTVLFREPPANWTYPDIQSVLPGYLEVWLQESGDGGANDF